jgi:hypothetical protein
MTVAQCLRYALTRPAVAAVMLGMQTVREVDEAFAYYQATEEEKDFAPVLARGGRGTLEGRCMYCNHCLPCPAHIDVAAVNNIWTCASWTGYLPPPCGALPVAVRYRRRLPELPRLRKALPLRRCGHLADGTREGRFRPIGTACV